MFSINKFASYNFINKLPFLLLSLYLSIIKKITTYLTSYGEKNHLKEVLYIKATIFRRLCL